MKRHTLQNSLKKSGKIAASLAAFVLAISVALPLRAADDHSDRAVKQRVSPVYPELAKRMRVSGVVHVSATVSPDGKVTATKTVSGNHMLSGAAEDAVQKWRFVAGPDESTVDVEINFALAQ